MNTSLTGKNALVCGASQGIGRAIAIELASLGAQITAVSRSEEPLQQLMKELPAQAGQVHQYLTVDFADRVSLQSKVESALEDRKYHILINNSGGPKGGPIFQAQSEEFVSAFAQHVLCNQLLAQLLVPGMRTEGYGRIVNIISTSVRIPIAGLGVSNTIRGAVASWAKTLSNELGPDGITVNNVLPGFTATGRLDQIIQNKASKQDISLEEVSRRMKSQVPMGRFGAPAEIASVAAFLCTPAAAYLTGVSIPVDGGRTGCI